ncbi:MAG: FAD-dependent oxidoreductase [Pirellulaceae bacterium]
MARRSMDVVVIGSGFSGSLLAWILAAAGRSVVLLDRGTHPRFAIGESSTPLADFLLEQIADEFSLSALRPLARWGTWQTALPHLRAGPKRGFSYYQHQRHQPFHESEEHEASLLVAASNSDQLADTHWMRSDVDHWFAQQAVAAGVQLLEGCEITEIQIGDSTANGKQKYACRLATRQDAHETLLETKEIVDASGGGAVLPRQLNLSANDEQLANHTATLFGHFRNVGSMTQWLQEHGLSTNDDPFPSDAAAQHHLLENGWMWMLRFAGPADERITSVGIVCEQDRWHQSLIKQDRHQMWKQLVSQYPTLDELLCDSELVAPFDSSLGTPQLGWIPRISRCWSVAAGENWSLLPSTVGIIDPLHSTGIAHALSGVLRVARYLLK